MLAAADVEKALTISESRPCAAISAFQPSLKGRIGVSVTSLRTGTAPFGDLLAGFVARTALELLRQP